MSVAQQEASDPRVSAFVSAHAGTGKTKLLVDRLARLMLAGADPARILCLTYTKAAAAEMAIRLQSRLGGWVTLDDAALDAQLAGLPVAPTAENRQRARELFARVLDLPGGMRISTIHAFCQSLLKRFPLEAAISPHFRLVEPPDARATLEQAREFALPRADPAAIAALAGLVSADGFAGLVSALEQKRDALAPALARDDGARAAAFRRAAGAGAGDEAAARARGVTWADEGVLRAAAALAARHGSDTIRARAERMLDWLGLPASLRAEHWASWMEEFCTADGNPRGMGALANKKLADQYHNVVPAFAAEQARIGQVQDQCRAIKLAAASDGLVRLAAPVLAGYAAAKGRRGLLDYHDLIGRTRALLGNPEIGSAWVLFKLDGGLDHLLLDEVQDTAPEQWEIADRLTGDFFVGEGARAEGLARTVFAVGDRKQSIYSFQGADPEEFDRWRGIYAKRVRQAGLAWRETTLDVSFRSTGPVLALVDAVFALPDAAAGVTDGVALRHVVNRVGHAGRVELWPLAPRPEAPEHTPWAIPDCNQGQVSAPQTLVNHLSAWIAGEVARGAVRPGEVLVLVRRRGDFDRALVRAIKAVGVPVAGLDRMVLTEQPAVQDLMALCDSLLLPGDDLSFAEFLVSPLGGLTDESLMDLAVLRQAPLWEVLRARAAERADWAQAWGFFSALLGRVDYAAPYALLSEALGALGGRARLFARLGAEAAEPVDEFLAASLLYASAHPASLQGFLHWIRLAAAEVKREAEAAGDSVRIMTVHGSKGLESRLVILPDTTGLPPDERGLAWAMEAGSGVHLPLWQPHKDFRCEAVEALRQARAAQTAREHNRLLYVALTRARDRLLVCGWALKTPQEGCWYDKVARGMAALGAQSQPFSAWPGAALVMQSAGSVPQSPALPAAPVALPDWAGHAPHWRPAPLPPEPKLPRPLAPSRPDGVELGPVPAARSPLAAGDAARFGRGLAMHALLQHLPDMPVAQRWAAALGYARLQSGVGDAQSLAAEALAVIDMPELTGLFGAGSRAEQPVSGVVADLVVSGVVDRLSVMADRVLIADYKTNRGAPARVEDVPLLYLRQMAAYRAVLAMLYPDRPVVCVLIWTEGPRIMVLPQAVLDAHAPGVAKLDPRPAMTTL
jgi:ATP-dependent helicase/nuclease subunit A